MNGTASALLAVVGAFLIAAALHGCEAEARPGDYTKRACARGNAKACVRLCDRGFRGYCGSTERRSKSLRTDVRAKRSWPGSAEETRPPLPVPRVPHFDDPIELDEDLRAVFTADDAPRHLPADAPTFRVDDAFNVTASEPLVPYRVRKLSEDDMRRLAEQWQKVERLPATRPPERSYFRGGPLGGGLVTVAILLVISLLIFHALFARRRRPAPNYPHDPYLPTM